MLVIFCDGKTETKGGSFMDGLMGCNWLPERCCRNIDGSNKDSGAEFDDKGPDSSSSPCSSFLDKNKFLI